MRIAICDDEMISLDRACMMLEKWAGLRNIPLEIQRFTNGDDLLTALQTGCPDLVFLDVVMPLFNGIDTARELRAANETLPIIFLTSSKEFAVDSYEVKALNYLIKPVSKEHLFAVLDDFARTIQKPEEVFMAQTPLGFCKITIADVDYLEAQNKQVLVHLSNGTTLQIREQFTRCEEAFTEERGFFRCHRSYIVNMKRIEQFSKDTIMTDNQVELPISRNSYMAFKEAYFNYMFDSETL